VSEMSLTSMLRASAPAGCGRARARHALLGLPLPEQLHLRAELRDLLREGGGHRVCEVRGRDGGGGGEEEVGGSRELYSFYSGLRALPFCQTGISRTLCCCTERIAKVLFHWLGAGSPSPDDCGHDQGGCISAGHHGSGFHHDLDPRASQVLASRSQIQVLFL
jgi:hypothetical protein